MGPLLHLVLQSITQCLTCLLYERETTTSQALKNREIFEFLTYAEAQRQVPGKTRRQMKTLSIKLFGRMLVSDESGATLPISGKKRQALLAYLALNPDQPPSRDELMALLWGDRFENQARQSLRECISRLRKALTGGGGDIGPLRADRDHVWLEQTNVRIDTRTLSQIGGLATAEAAVDPGQLVAAAELYDGPLLGDLNIQQAEFDDWLQAARVRHNETAATILARLAGLSLQHGDVERALQLGQRILSFDPLDEGSHRALMAVHIQNGQPSAAIRQFQACEDILRRELDVEPGPRKQALYDQIRADSTSGSTSDQSQNPTWPAAAIINALPGQAHKPRITVRPFTNLSVEADQEFFASGITADIVSALARNRWLAVIAHHASTDFAAAPPNDDDGLGQLPIDYLVEGSVRKAGNRVRITAQLLDAANREHIW